MRRDTVGSDDSVTSRAEQSIYCFGDKPYVLEFSLMENRWEQHFIDAGSSDFKGNKQYTSICRVGHSNKFLLTGGCAIEDNEPQSAAYRVSISQLYQAHSAAGMSQRRYGHCSVYMSGYVLVIGGYDHRNLVQATPHTLASCEKYSPKENDWTSTSYLNVPRAFAALCKVDAETAYVFGGFCDFKTLNSIEKYNIMLDQWSLLNVKLPLKLAKLGAALSPDARGVVIMGGLYCAEDSQTTLLNNVYKLDLESGKWSKLPKMCSKRIHYSSVPATEDGFICIGGAIQAPSRIRPRISLFIEVARGVALQSSQRSVKWR